MKKKSASSRHKKTTPASFDPFNDRLSRDIRNTLAETFVDKLKNLDPAPPLLTNPELQS
jgi:hypothetical protein